MLHFLVWAILAALKPKVLLVAENLCLRQQLLLLQRKHPQTRLRNADRQFWICPEVASTGLACLLVLAIESAAPKEW